MSFPHGQHSSLEAKIEPNNKVYQRPYYNNLTRRNTNIAERFPQKSMSTSLASANIKALRLFRYICRMVPYILNVHEVQHRFDNLQTKRYIANHFRRNSKMDNLTAIDAKIQWGYETVHEAEWHFSNTGYLYQFFVGPKGVMRDQGKDRFYENRGNQNKTEPASTFLKGFYKGHKSNYK